MDPKQARMRVVIITDFAFPSGGAPRVALESARGLAEACVPVLYVHAIGLAGSELLDHPRIDRVGLGFPDIWDLPRARGAVTGLWNAAAAQRLRRLLASQPVGETVVHLHQWTRAFSPSIFRVLADSGHPFAITLHDYSLVCPNGVYYRFEKELPCATVPLSWACLRAACDPKSPSVKA